MQRQEQLWHALNGHNALIHWNLAHQGLHERCFAAVGLPRDDSCLTRLYSLDQKPVGVSCRLELQQCFLLLSQLMRDRTDMLKESYELLSGLNE